MQVTDDDQNPEDHRFDSLVEVLADVARRQEELAVAIDRRLSAIEARLEAAATGGPPTSTPALSMEVATRRLAELRAERARVQDRLREERLLAAQPGVDESADETVGEDVDVRPATGKANSIWPERDDLIWPHHGGRTGGGRRRR